MKEKVIITFIATVAGLLLTTLVFYFYQTSKPLQPENSQKGEKAGSAEKKGQPIPTQVSSSKLFIEMQDPADEALVEERSVTIKGKTNSNNIIIISSSVEDAAITPSENGSFTGSITVEAGSNIITTLAISPQGETVKDQRIITYSIEEF